VFVCVCCESDESVPKPQGNARERDRVGAQESGVVKREVERERGKFSFLPK